MRFAAVLLVILAACGGSAKPAVTAPAAAPKAAAPKAPPAEHPVRLLPLGKYADAKNEFSGLGWWGDTLVILPQYPERLGNAVLGVEKEDILDFLDAKRADLPIRTIPFRDHGVWKRIAKVRPNTSYEGYEAIAFDGGDVFMTMEASRTGDGAGTLAYLLTGHADPKHGIVLSGEFTELPVQTSIDNLGYEALIVRDREVYALHELNDDNNPNRQVWVYDRITKEAEPRPMDKLPYRLTDAAADERSGDHLRAWAMNYQWQGSEWTSSSDALTAAFGQGATHAASKAVERIVTLDVSATGVQVPNVAPVQLELGAGDSRNWEGIAHLPERGFLLITDEHPSSLFGFVAE